jgi:RimJ/RimL family protein N-acetyltransferase
MVLLCRWSARSRSKFGRPEPGRVLTRWEPQLHTARLRLRPFTDADAGSIFALHSSAYVLPLLGPPAVERPGPARAFIAMRRKSGRRHRGAGGYRGREPQHRDLVHAAGLLPPAELASAA